MSPCGSEWVFVSCLTRLQHAIGFWCKILSALNWCHSHVYQLMPGWMLNADHPPPSKVTGVTRLTNDLTNPAQGSQIGTREGGSAGVTPCRHDNRCWRHSRGQEVGAAFLCHACSKGLWAGQSHWGLGQPPMHSFPHMDSSANNISQCPAVDMQDPHLPPDTAAVGTCWISCTQQPIFPGKLDPDPAGKIPYP